MHVGIPIEDLHLVTNTTSDHPGVDSFIWPQAHVEFTLEEAGLIAGSNTYPEVRGGEGGGGEGEGRIRGNIQTDGERRMTEIF